MCVSDFLETLPTYNENNFSKFHTDSSNRTCVKRATLYITTEEKPSDQIIMNEKTNILLRYLRQRWGSKSENNQSKKNPGSDNTHDEPTPSKRTRYE